MIKAQQLASVVVFTCMQLLFYGKNNFFLALGKSLLQLFVSIVVFGYLVLVINSYRKYLIYERRKFRRQFGSMEGRSFRHQLDQSPARTIPIKSMASIERRGSRRKTSEQPSPRATVTGPSPSGISNMINEKRIQQEFIKRQSHTHTHSGLSGSHDFLELKDDSS